MISRVVAALADSALLLPASAIVALYLASLRRWQLLVAWCTALVLAGSMTVLSKLVFHACGHEITSYDVVSPSGHTSFATVFYGGLAIMLGTGRPLWVKRCLGAATCLFVFAVCISRVRTESHTPIEVVMGVAMGAIALALFAVLHARAGRPWIPIVPVAAGFVTLVLLLGGLHVNFEAKIGGVARRLSAALDICSRPERVGLRFPLARD